MSTRMISSRVSPKKAKYAVIARFGLFGSSSFLAGPLVSEGTYDSISFAWRALSCSAFSFHFFLSASDIFFQISPAAFAIFATSLPLPPNCFAMISWRPTSFNQMKYALRAFFGLTSVVIAAAVRFDGEAGAAFADFGDATAVLVVVGFGDFADIRKGMRKQK